jgi:hypothetical protein
MSENGKDKRTPLQGGVDDAAARAEAVRGYCAEIYADPDNLSPAAVRFARDTERGQREMRMARAIVGGIASIPRVPVPARLRAMIFDRISGPAYRWYHLAAACVMTALSPLVFQHVQSTGSMQIDATYLPWVFFCFGLLNLMLVFPLAFFILQNRRHRIEELGRSFDDYLEHPSRLFSRFRS